MTLLGTHDESLEGCERRPRASLARALPFALALVGLTALAIWNPALARDPAIAEETSPAELFRQRILPILNSDKPSSCTECHLGGVDLKDYLSSDPMRTFAALHAAGLVNPAAPDESKILKQILMQRDDSSPIQAEVRAREYEAFRAWIFAASLDEDFAMAEFQGEPLGPKVSNAVIRHARRDRLLASFLENVWAERGRCWNCHAPGPHPVPKHRQRKLDWIEEYGEEILWLAGDGPEEVMMRLLQSENIDLEDPRESLLLRKPTEQEEHEGGLKMRVGDRAYRQFLRFIEDYAKIRTYQSEAELPPYIKTRQWLRVRGVPVTRFTLMEVRLHRKDKSGGWQSKPFATAIGGALKGVWAAPLDLRVERGSPEFARLQQTAMLPPDRYLLRFYLDTEKKLQQPPYRLEAGDLSGELEISARRWPKDRSDETQQRVDVKRRSAKEVRFPGKRRSSGKRRG